MKRDIAQETTYLNKQLSLLNLDSRFPANPIGETGDAAPAGKFAQSTYAEQSAAAPLDLRFRAQSSAKSWEAVLSEVGGAGAPASLRRSKAQRRASAPGWWWELRQGL